MTACSRRTVQRNAGCHGTSRPRSSSATHSAGRVSRPRPLLVGFFGARLSAWARSDFFGFASELEFYVYQTSYERFAEFRYRAPRPAYHRAGDNDLLVDGVVEPLLGDIRRLMPQAGIPIELSQGEGGIGQFEVSLRYAPPVEMADHHSVYKLGVKALAQRRGLAVTFMAKPETAQVGSSCRVHVSLRHESGANAICGDDDRLTRTGEQFLAGLLAFSSELCLLFAPTPNSYRRLLPGSWAPATVTWGVEIARHWYGSRSSWGSALQVPRSRSGRK